MMKRVQWIVGLAVMLMLSLVLISCGGAADDTTEEPITGAESGDTAEEMTETEEATETEAETDAAKPLRVVCVGDSITAGYMASDTVTKSYPAVLQTLLPEGSRVTNCGVGRSTAIPKTSKYFNTNGIDYTTTNQYLAGQTSRADIVLIMLGANDAKMLNLSDEASVNEFYTSLKAIGETYANSETHPEIWILSSTYRYEDGAKKARTEMIVVPTQKKLAEDMGWHYLDLYTPTKAEAEAGHTSLYADKLHFTDAGYAFVAGLVAEALLAR